MNRSTFAVMALCAVAACSAGPTDLATVPSPDAFAGAWRSVTPSREFMRLSVNSTSSETGVLGARLTFSGVEWEGGGRIDGDSLVISMGPPGTRMLSGIIAARADNAQTLHVQVRPASAAAFDLTFVRDD